MYIINMTGDNGSPCTTPMLVSKGGLSHDCSLTLAEELLEISVLVVFVAAPASASRSRAFLHCTVSNSPLKSSSAAE